MKTKLTLDKLHNFLQTEYKSDGKKTLNRKAYSGQIAIDPNEERTIIAKISTINTDRDMEVIDPQGVDITQFMTNPVVLWDHQHSDAPIGKILKIEKTKQAIYAKIKMATTQKATEVWKLIKGGFVKACSIGFIVNENITKGTQKFIEKAKELGADIDNTVNIITACELVENSFVSIPSNRDALITAISSKSISLSDDMRKSLGVNKLCGDEDEDEKIDKDTKEITEVVDSQEVTEGADDRLEEENLNDADSNSEGVVNEISVNEEDNTLTLDGIRYRLVKIVGEEGEEEGESNGETTEESGDNGAEIESIGEETVRENTEESDNSEESGENKGKFRVVSRPDKSFKIVKLGAIGAKSIKLVKKGGPGSGNFGHEGRPGEVGGSGGGGGGFSDVSEVGAGFKDLGFTKIEGANEENLPMANALHEQATELTEYSIVRASMKDRKCHVELTPQINRKGRLGEYDSGWGKDSYYIKVATTNTHKDEGFKLSTPDESIHSVSLDPKGVFRHEMGHQVQASLRDTPAQDTWISAVEADFAGDNTFRAGGSFNKKAKQAVMNSVSRYGASHETELFAECFSAYTSPEYKNSKQKLPKNIHNFMSKLLVKK